jgi:citrate lyase subunit gamma (acyl carrier protein)
MLIEHDSRGGLAMSEKSKPLVVLTTGSAGSLTSGDCLVEVKPGVATPPVVIVRSNVEKRFGLSIREACERVLREHDLSNVTCLVQDRGALEFVIEARLLTALLRASGGEAR